MSRRPAKPKPRSRAEQGAALGITTVVAGALLLLLARHDLFLVLVVGSVYAGLAYLIWRSTA